MKTIDIENFNYNPIATTTFAIGGFLSDWGHCSQLADYLARFCSVNQDDPERFTNFFSTVLNTILEMIFKNTAESGEIQLNLGIRDDFVYLDIKTPVDEKAETFYMEMIEMIESNDPAQLYKDELTNIAKRSPHPALGFFELAAGYDTRIGVQRFQEEDVILKIYIQIGLKDISENNIDS